MTPKENSTILVISLCICNQEIWEQHEKKQSQHYNTRFDKGKIIFWFEANIEFQCDALLNITLGETHIWTF